MWKHCYCSPLPPHGVRKAIIKSKGKEGLLLFQEQKRCLSSAVLLRTNLEDDGVVVLTLNRPKVGNALNQELLGRLKDELDKIAQEHATYRVLVLKAASGSSVFCSGHDLKEMIQMKTPKEFNHAFDLCSQVMQGFGNLPQPVISIVQGVATGAGCQLVAATDQAIAGRESARFATPGVTLGLFCSTPSVPLGRTIGRKAAMEMLLTGRLVPADEALRLGLVSHVTEENETESFAMEYAKRVASSSGIALRIGKQAFNAHMQAPNLAEAYNIASKAMVENVQKYDAQEGIRSFLSKKKPQWKHS